MPTSSCFIDYVGYIRHVSDLNLVTQSLCTKLKMDFLYRLRIVTIKSCQTLARLPILSKNAQRDNHPPHSTIIKRDVSAKRNIAYHKHITI